jgi:hypothetical protein
MGGILLNRYKPNSGNTKNSIKLSESLQRTIDFEQRTLLDGAVVQNRNSIVNSLIYQDLVKQPILLVTPSAQKEEKLYSIVPNNAAFDFDVFRATTATYINEQGILTNAAIDEVRIEFPYNSNTPYLLIEDQITNLYTFSEELDNVSWNKVRLNETGTPPWVNVGIAPDGTQTAEKLIPNTDNQTHFLIRPQLNWSGRAVFNGFFKADGYDGVFIVIFEQGTFANRIQIRINLNNGSELPLANNELGAFVGSNYESQITPFPNGWYRIQIGCDVPVTVNNISTQLSVMDGNNQVFAGNNTDGVLAWGLQLSDSFGSYIPTDSSIVTKTQDLVTINTPTGVNQILEYFTDGSINTVNTIPSVYQIPYGKIKKIVML